MNQVFTKKKLAAALTLAFVAGGAALLAVAPVPGLVAAAQADQSANASQNADWDSTKGDIWANDKRPTPSPALGSDSKAQTANEGWTDWPNNDGVTADGIVKSDPSIKFII